MRTETFVKSVLFSSHIVLVFNNKTYDAEWIQKMEDILSVYYHGIPRKISGEWKKVIDAFEPLEFVEHKFMKGCQSIKVCSMAEKSLLLSL